MLTVLAWISAAAAGGFIGGRTDWLSCRAIKGISDALSRPENHDLARGLASALLKSLRVFFADVEKANPFPGLRDFLSESESTINHLEVDAPSASLKRLVMRLQDNLSGFLALVESDERMAQRREVEEQIVQAVLEWISDQLRQPVPDLLARAVRVGISTANGSADSWSSYFRLYLGEIIKAEDFRFREILQTELAASAKVLADENLAVSKDVLLLLSAATAIQDTPKWEACVLEKAKTMTVDTEDVDKAMGVGVLDDPSRNQALVGQGYAFTAACGFDASNVALIEEYCGEWHPMQLRRVPGEVAGLLHRRSHERLAAFAAGAIRVPLQNWYRERNRACVGLHRFVLIATRSPLPEKLAQLIMLRSRFNQADLHALAEHFDSVGEDGAALFLAELMVQERSGNQ